MIVKIQVLEKLIKTDHRDSQIQTEKFKGEPISALSFKVTEEQPQVFKQTTLIYPVILQKQLPNDRYPQGCARIKCTPVEILDLRRFKEAIVAYGEYALTFCEANAKLMVNL